MAKTNRGNKKTYIIISILLLLVIVLGIVLYFYFDKQLKDKIKSNTNIKEEKTAKENELKKKEAELTKLTEELNEYNGLDKKIEELKKDYFKSIKELEDQIISGKSNAKIAYLTFDDGPYYNTYKVLDILDKYNVKATFFTISMNGENCFDNKKENCYKLYKEYVKRGHTIANHTYTHAIFKGLYKSTDSFMDAIVKQEEQIKNQTGGYITNIVRFPGGSRTAGKLKEPIIEALRKRGYGWVDWTAEDGDGGGLSSKEQGWSTLTSLIDEKIEVILFHDYNSITTSLLPDAIEHLQKKGYILLPLFYESNMVNK